MTFFILTWERVARHGQADKRKLELPIELRVRFAVVLRLKLVVEAAARAGGPPLLRNHHRRQRHFQPGLLALRARRQQLSARPLWRRRPLLLRRRQVLHRPDLGLDLLLGPGERCADLRELLLDDGGVGDGSGGGGGQRSHGIHI